MATSSLLIIYDNAVDRASSISANNTTAGSASNVQNDVKGKIHRGTSPVTFTIAWSSNQPQIGAIAIPMANLPLNTTVSGSITHSGGTYTIPSTNIVPYTDISEFGSSAATVNDFAAGRYSSGFIVLPQTYTSVSQLVLTVTSGTSSLDISRIVAGRVFKPERFASAGIQHSILNAAESNRLSTGNIVLDAGFQYSTLSFDLRYMQSTDRDNLIKLLKITGSKNVFVSLFSTDSSRLIYDYSIYGRITNSPITAEFYGIYSTTLSIESW